MYSVFSLLSLFLLVISLCFHDTIFICQIGSEGAQWLSGRVLDSRPKGCGFEPHRRHCVVSLSKNINPSLVLVQPRKTRPFITERLLMGRKESNQTNKQTNKQIGSEKNISQGNHYTSWKQRTCFYLLSSCRRCLNLQWPCNSKSDYKTAALSFITCLHCVITCPQCVWIWIYYNTITKVMLSAWLSKLSKLLIVGCTIGNSYR